MSHDESVRLAGEPSWCSGSETEDVTARSVPAYAASEPDLRSSLLPAVLLRLPREHWQA